MKKLLTAGIFILTVTAFSQTSVNGFIHQNGNIELTPARAREIYVSYKALEQRYQNCERLATGLNAIITEQAAFMTEAADSLAAYKSKYDALQKAEVREVSKPKKWSVGVGAGATYSIPRAKVEPVIFVGVMRNLWSF